MEDVKESARRCIPDERAWAAFAAEALASEPESDMRLLERSRPRRSIDSVRWVWRVSRTWMWTGKDCERVSVCGAMVRNWRLRVWCVMPYQLYSSLSKQSAKGGYIYPLDNARADSSDGALDPFVAQRAHDQRAARINRRQQRIAVFQAMLEALAGLQGPPDNPCQLAFLVRD